MTIDQLRGEVDPFRPFVMHLADGRNVAVQSREFMFIPPEGRTVVVWQPDEKIGRASCRERV